MSKRAGESFATSSSATRKPVHCSGLIARKLNNQNADKGLARRTSTRMSRLGATPRVKTCVSNILEELTKRRQEHQAPDQQQQARGDQLPLKTCQVVRKFIIAQILTEKIHQEVRRSERGGGRNSYSNNEQHLCLIWSRSHRTSEFPAQHRDLEPIHDRLLMGFI